MAGLREYSVRAVTDFGEKSVLSFLRFFEEKEEANKRGRQQKILLSQAKGKLL